MSDERDLRAAEYVLGTLPGAERAAFEHEMEHDPILRALVTAWERRLDPLADDAAAVAPSPTLWTSIEHALDPAPPNTVLDVDAVDRLRRSRRLWRGTTVAASALAAGLALFIAAGDRLTGPGESYIAVVNRGGDLPALIVQVDRGAGLVRVRSILAEAPADRSLELWYIGAGRTPRSLGVVDDSKRQLALPAVAREADLAGATLAVTVEPKGGSPTGGPTGPIVYSGQLIRD